MRSVILVLVISISSFSLNSCEDMHEKINTKYHSIVDNLSTINKNYEENKAISSLEKIEEMLHKEAPNLNVAVINKATTSIQCANEYNVNHNNILTIIDYSLPSSEKRLWVFDLSSHKLLFNTYVSHGIKSGVSSSQYFSNKFNSKASSIGVYKTDKIYFGRHGLSLALQGLDQGFNDNASGRAVVMHGGWYVDEPFIKKYGRAGRSWGCPAVPSNLTEAIINTIKDKSIFVIYYPSDSWFVKSKFLSCNKLSTPIAESKQLTSIEPPKFSIENRGDVLFAQVNAKKKGADSEPILVMSVANYENTFHSKVPLERMLRRQINNTEYIALSSNEFKTIIGNNQKSVNETNNDNLNNVNFVIPVIKNIRGYYATEMQIINLGKIKDVSLNSSGSDIKGYTVHFDENHTVNLKPTSQFIRWLGL